MHLATETCEINIFFLKGHQNHIEHILLLMINHIENCWTVWLKMLATSYGRFQGHQLLHQCKVIFFNYRRSVTTADHLPAKRGSLLALPWITDSLTGSQWRVSPADAHFYWRPPGVGMGVGGAYGGDFCLPRWPGCRWLKPSAGTRS